MLNTTRFLLTEKEAGVAAADAPGMVRIRQKFPRPVEEDIEGAVRRELTPFLTNVQAGQRIGITGSSRGISNYLRVIKECVAAIKETGAQPFIFPGMGSHGGATAEGQIDVLANTHGITEDSVGCPVEATMDVVQVGTTASNFPVYQDRLAHEADGVLVVNRVKPHTGFTEKIESGLSKMLVIGMGKQAGASRIHQQALRIDMGDLILDASRIIVDSARPQLLGGIALVENAFKETACIKGVPMASFDEMIAVESKLLEQAYDLLARLPFEDIDALVVDEMGKNIAGSGMDTNVIGKKPGMVKPRIGCIFVRALTEQTHGNATGIGAADLILRSMFEGVDLNSTYMNAFTAKRPIAGKIPMLMETELQAIQVMLNFRQDTDPASLRMVWIRNTSKLDEMWISEALLDEARANSNLEILGEAQQLTFDAELAMVAPT